MNDRTLLERTAMCPICDAESKAEAVLLCQGCLRGDSGASCPMFTSTGEWPVVQAAAALAKEE